MAKTKGNLKFMCMKTCQSNFFFTFKYLLTLRRLFKFNIFLENNLKEGETINKFGTNLEYYVPRPRKAEI